jgi:hypothetical protein
MYSRSKGGEDMVTTHLCCWSRYGSFANAEFAKKHIQYLLHVDFASDSPYRTGCLSKLFCSQYNIARGVIYASGQERSKKTVILKN